MLTRNLTKIKSPHMKQRSLKAMFSTESTSTSDRRTRIANLLSPNSSEYSMEPETIVLNAPKPIYAGTLTICPTPIGNLEDMTLQAYHKLNETDIVACEDKNVASKLFTTLEKKKLGEKFRNFFETKMLLNDYKYDTDSFFRNRRDLFGDGMSQDLSLTDMEIPEHPNLFEVRRERKKLREIQKM